MGKWDLAPSSSLSSLWTMQLLEEHTERAPRISQEFGERMAYCCLGGLAEFLQRYGGLGAGLAGGGSWEELKTPDPIERRDERKNQGRMNRGASVGTNLTVTPPSPSPPPASSSVWSDSMRTQESESCYQTLTSAGPLPWSTAGPP